VSNIANGINLWQEICILNLLLDAYDIYYRFRLQRYCFFITLTIGFEEYFGELKTVKYIFNRKRHRVIVSSCQMHFYILCCGSVKDETNTIFKIYILYYIYYYIYNIIYKNWYTLKVTIIEIPNDTMTRCHVTSLRGYFSIIW